jgi:phosphopantothenoylcysteine decarboxylase
MVNVLLGVTGSVAATKLLPLLDALTSPQSPWAGNCKIRLISTSRAEHFLAPQSDQIAAKVEAWYRDADEWAAYTTGDPVLHIELRRWASVFVIAPLSANTLAKMAHGLCDTLLTCVARAWDFSPRKVGKVLMVAPAMNTMMWEHPVTTHQLSILGSWGVVIVPPVEKRLACGDVGMGAMAPIDAIVSALASAVSSAPTTTTTTTTGSGST